jgi:5'-nucleotidase/UDP-sugar diphosphatase
MPGLRHTRPTLPRPGYVTLVDAGDFSQGSTMATLSSGEYLVELMNAVGYDIVVPGNHEFDYGMAQAQKNLAALKAKVISCNFVDLATKKPVYDAFTTVKYGDTTVAYVGICTPETYTKSTPTYFQDKNGNYTYSFCENSFYQTIQSSIDAAKAAGAKYVVAVGHCGIDAQSTPWTSSEIIANTTGLCAFIDGHSHSTVASQDVKDKDGKTVVLTQAGTKLGAVGKLTIKADGTITSELITKYDGKDEAVAAKITEIEGKYKSTISNVVAKSSVNLIAKNADGSWACRDAETNMGDLIADAYRVVMGADIGVMNGGGIRDNIAAGDVTMGDILAVMTFGNMATVVKATGQQIKDCLEMGASAYPGKSGGFVQVSGMTYTIDSTVPSSVVKDAKGNFQSVSGEYRVKDIMVAGKPIDLAKTYTVACHSYWLTNYGDGMTMFKGCPTIPEKHEKYVDNYMLSLYIQNNLKGVIGTQYAAPQGRITILCTACKTFSDVVSGSWYDSYVKYCLDNKLMTSRPDGREVLTTDRNLLEFDSGAGAFELGLELLGLFLGNAFLDLGRDAFDKGLGLCETQAGDGADFLDDGDLVCAEAGHNDVKLGLLLDGSGSGGGSGSCGGGGGDAEGLLESMYELAELENGKALDLFDHGIYFFTSHNEISSNKYL